MTMHNSNVLDTLTDLAAQATDEAAKRLSVAIRQTDDARAKLTLLQQYRDEYASRMQDSLRTGLTADGFRNFQAFLSKLDNAIFGQQQVLTQNEVRVAQQRLIWQESERKRISYDTLVTRAEKTELLRESKRDQKDTDELATRKYLNRR